MSMAIILSGVARFAFMMVGGTLSDRFSPRQLILTAGSLRLVLLAAIIGIALTGQMSVLALYGFSFAAGMTDAIFLPARGAIMPLLVEQEFLKAANAIASAQEKLWGMVGPAMAGLVITFFNHAFSPADTKSVLIYGPTVAFVINVLAIGTSILILRPVKFSMLPDQPAPELDSQPQNGSIRDLISLIRHQASLRVSFLTVYAINCISSGPLYIGMPMLAVSRFPEGAQALGFLTSALGGGALIGTLLAGLLPQPKPGQIGRLFLGVIVGMCVGLFILLFSLSVVLDMLAILVVAALISYINVTGIVQIQKDTPPAFMGRMMGLLNLK